MSPKGKSRPSLTSSPGAVGHAAAGAPAGIDMDPAFMYSSDCNAHLTVRIRDAQNTLDGTDLFRDINAALPLGISSDSDAGSGVQAPF